MVTTSNEDSRFVARREAMVAEQLVARGIANRRVLDVMRALPRHRFVVADQADAAYEDRPLPIGHGQTISQPYMVARTTELADPAPGERALEIGAGCGYQLAVLAMLCGEAYGVELVPELAATARETLQGLGLANAVVDSFDGSGGWPAHAPYDVIVVSAAAPRVPPLLVDQLADGGRLVVPVGESQSDQELLVIRRHGHDYTTTRDTRCRYVDLLGRYGFGQVPPRA